MRSALRSSLFLLVLPVALIASCGLFGGTSSYRFRMTVEADTPQGARTGSSVMEVLAAKEIFHMSETHPVNVGMRADAPMIEAPGGPVFALLENSENGELLLNNVSQALNPKANAHDPDVYMRRIRELGSIWSSHEAELPRESWPIFVQFRDPADPMSLRKVDPSAIGIKRIKVETTRDPVTRGIEEKLPWLDNLEQFETIKGNPFSNTVPREVAHLRSGKRDR